MMFSAKELKLVYGATIVLLLIAVVSYAALPSKPPKQPIRIAFQSVAGKVLFDHSTHQTVEGYGLACGECHHTLAPDEYDQAGACTDCHNTEEGDEDVPKRSDALHQQCIGCHENYGTGPTDCYQCHMLQ
jgi:Class III cytochrome C family